jgi:hypothetical protein
MTMEVAPEMLGVNGAEHPACGHALSPRRRLHATRRIAEPAGGCRRAGREAIETVPLGSRPERAAITSGGETLFAVSRDENKSHVVSAKDLSVQREAAPGAEPHGVASRP